MPDTTVSNGLRNEVLQLWQSDRISGSDLSADAELQRAYRDLGKRSLYFWTKAILGYPDLTTRTHLPYCNFLQDLRNQHTLDLMPRGTFKTTCGTIGFGTWYPVNVNINHWILVANQTELNAERMLIEMEGHFDGSNPVVNWLYPQHIKPGDRWKPWSGKMMTLPGRSVISGTPTIMTMGVGARAESWHFHVIIRDDLVGSKAMASEREMLGAIAWHDYSTSLFVSPQTGISRDHGTRWDLGDLYAVLLKDPKYRYYIRAAKDPVTGELLFPELLDEEMLREIRERNFALYMSQYMNDPENPDVLEFKKAWLNQYWLIKTDRGPACKLGDKLYYVCDMHVVMAVDPAASGDLEVNFGQIAKTGRAKKSNNAIVLWGLHPSGYYFLLDSWAGRAVGDSPELQVCEQMYNMCRAWDGYFSKIYVEAYGAHGQLITLFKQFARQQGKEYPIEDIARGIQKAKVVRIRTALGGPGANKQVCVRPSHDNFIYEFSRFPQDLYAMDTLDATTWAFTKLKLGQTPLEELYADEVTKRQLRNMKLQVGRGGY